MATVTPQAMTPAATPCVMTTEPFNSPFSSRTVIIVIGVTKKPFTVHEAKLAQTSFFEVHGLPQTSAGRPLPGTNSAHSTNPNSSEVESFDGVKQEDGLQDLHGTDSSMPSTHDVGADYHICDKFFLKPAAFDVFVSYLYNEVPAVPISASKLKTLLQAYGIALQYKCYGLQNKIVDCIRSYYSRTHVRLDDLVWAANRFGDNVQCPLNAYLVEQVAFEIADRGLTTFTADNAFTVAFLEQGDRAIRASLFAAVARLAQNAKIHDPATGRIRYHVHEKGDRAGQLKG